MDTETKTQKQIKIRQVTQYQMSWTEQERGEPGAFTIQLILDNGVDEYVLSPSASDADLLLKLLQRSAHATFDAERKVVMFNNISVD